MRPIVRIDYLEGARPRRRHRAAPCRSVETKNKLRLRWKKPDAARAKTAAKRNKEKTGLVSRGRQRYEKNIIYGK